MARDDQGQEFSSDSSANKLAISAREDSRANVHGRGPSSTLHQRPASVDTVREWARRWYQVLKENEQELRGLLAEADEVGIDIKGVYADGLVTAVAFSHDDVYPCYLQNDGKSFSAQCGCMAGSQFCPHTLALLEDMLLQLEDRSSPLASRIRRGEFNTNKPNFKIFQVDEKAKIKQLLDGLVPASPPQLDDEDASALPPVETATPNRLAWNILIRNNRVEAVAVLQQAKKRGNGWTKGRRIPLENLSDYSDLCSATDRKVRDLVHYVSQSYRPTYYLDSMQAIGQLIGAANVLLNGEPVEVHLADATLVFREDAEGCWLSLEHSVSGHSQ
ncbi:MAG: hypothetical protein KDA45_08150, partial [Planctomycetales bacterium]|nr:hypothetical protein [Planctomycetales bacterium]